MTNRTRLLAALAWALAGPARASFTDGDAGSRGGQFLKLGVSAREAAMGEAGAAAAYGAASMFYNPAAIVYAPRMSLSLLHASHLADTSYQYGAFVLKPVPRTALGVSIKRFAAGDVLLRDGAGAAAGTATPSDTAYTFAAAHWFRGQHWGVLSGLAFGATLTMVQSELVSKATTLTGGFGLRTRAYHGGRLRFGLSADNLFGRLKYDQVGDPLPAIGRFGILLTPVKEWDVSLEMDMPVDATPYFALGTEYALGPVALRAGYLARSTAEPGPLSGLSGGFGLALGRATVDYALVPFGQLGETHRVSLNLRFGK